MKIVVVSTIFCGIGLKKFVVFFNYLKFSLVVNLDFTSFLFGKKIVRFNQPCIMYNKLAYYTLPTQALTKIFTFLSFMCRSYTNLIGAILPKNKENN